MGRPLFSTLYASQEPVVLVADPTPSYETWSPKNAFDPDADEFFASDDVVYEAFLTPEEIVARESDSVPPVAQPENPLSSNAEYSSIRRTVLERMQQQTGAQLRAATEEDAPPGLLQEIDSSSEDTLSGQESPADATPPLSPSHMRNYRMLEAARRRFLSDRYDALQRRVNELEHEERQAGRGSSFDPALVDRLYNEFVSVPPLVIPGPTSAQDAALSPSTPTTPDRALPVAMTPPQSVTPRFLNWSRPPVNTPISPYRVPTNPGHGRMAVSYIAPAVSASPPTPLAMSVQQ